MPNNTEIQAAFANLKTAIDALDTSELEAASVEPISSSFDIGPASMEGARERWIRKIAELKSDIARDKAKADRLLAASD